MRTGSSAAAAKSEAALLGVLRSAVPRLVRGPIVFSGCPNLDRADDANSSDSLELACSLSLESALPRGFVELAGPSKLACVREVSSVSPISEAERSARSSRGDCVESTRDGAPG